MIFWLVRQVQFMATTSRNTHQTYASLLDTYPLSPWTGFLIRAADAFAVVATGASWRYNSLLIRCRTDYPIGGIPSNFCMALVR